MKQILISILLLCILSACDNENNIANTDEPEIRSLSYQPTYPLDTISIYGVNLKSDSLKLFLNDSNYSKNIISNTITKVDIVISDSMSTGFLYLEVNGKETNSLEIEISHSPGYETVEIEPGNFMMGSESGFPDESPVHNVEITHNLIAGKYEVSKQLWHYVMDSISLRGIEYNYPADSISWLNAVAFCNKLSDIYSLQKVYTIDGPNVTQDLSSNGWRLPTEAEWEYIGRAGSQEDYTGNGILDSMGWYDSNSGLQTHLPGEKLQNDFGLYDIHGNVWEWCWDRYSENYYENSPDIDPTGPATGSRHVIRGGSFATGKNYNRISNRQITNLNLKTIGIRLVRNNE